MGQTIKNAAVQPPPRERILAAARDLFYRHGIRAVGVDAIAEAAATNKMTLYRHFGSKDELISAYLQELAKEGDDLWQRLRETYPDDPHAQIEGWVQHVEQVLTDCSERGCAMANAAVEMREIDHPARQIIDDYKTRKRDQLVRLFSEAGYGEPEQVADEVFLLFEGARISIQCCSQGPALRVVRMLRSLLADHAPKVEVEALAARDAASERKAGAKSGTKSKET
ncbi:TetR/AcrR family transcriptional regulator [Hyphomicrobium sulfonivorans]|uniref:TetR/AcrR family transcriptional regulator n=1 Tax=Hyphomicrobium sulfonivorans TaxID=121290 RepID=UPI00156DB50C|nr:TetR/AcrR family transcriptional regulator [Hyphomicrobium sulfonivorans]MBI1651339.1 TetR/AcrR family transcriptional regulator [Hyphomicrobium sulfonivorans]NSL72790.1 TetR/AcrR family transcriptional regulator [Hyphomicrobium sulfonivorans]